ncbi:MAG: rhomboid family intramembrane serine protease [Firmicutes bacterium]|nr:rhomboid family intramembrane serine protease [[Eubacterium] siraeum]MCM1487312.1 rhomboid family intramembrane serine protease [Bacillota bacterium]
MNKLLDRLSYRYGRYGIPNLMLYIVIAMAGVFIVELFVPEMPLRMYLYFSRDLILAGDWWRILTWIIIPDETSIVFIIFSLYIYWMMGTALEQQWGVLKFNVYYFMGVILTIVGGFITGYTSNTYLYYAMFFAFAILYPDHQFLLFFFIPVKVKWLAIIDAVFFGLMLVLNIIGQNWSEVAAIIISLLNFILFFFRDFKTFFKNQIYYAKHRNKYKNNRYR